MKNTTALTSALRVFTTGRSSAICACASVLACFLSFGTSGYAQLYAYTTNSGDWNNAAIWNTPPVDGRQAFVTGNDTVTFQPGDSYTGAFNFGFWGNLIVGASDAFVGAGNGGTGTLNITGGNLTTGGWSVGAAAAGTINQSGGTFNAIGQQMLFGWGATATMNISGGTMNMTGAGTWRIGHTASSSINVTGSGVANFTGGMAVDAFSIINANGGTVNMSNATINIVAGSQLRATNGGSINLNGGNTFTGNGGFVLGGASAVNVNSGTNAFTGEVSLAANATVTAGSGTLLTLNPGTGAAVFLNAGRTLTIAGPGSVLVGGAINGSGNLNLAGAASAGQNGTVTLSGSNSFNGTFQAGGGFGMTLRVGHNNALGAGTVFLGQNLLLTSDGAATRTIGNTVNLANIAYYGDATGTGDLIFTGSNVASGNQRIMDVRNSTTISGVVSGDGGLDKRGAGTLTLAGSNSYTGGTTILAGTLRIFGGGSVAGNITNNATLNFDGAHNVTNAISGTGSMVVSGNRANDEITYLFGQATYTGATVLEDNSRLALSGVGGGISAATTVQIGANAFLDLASSGAPLDVNRTIAGLTGSGTVAGGANHTGTLTVNKASGSDTFLGVIRGGGTSLTKDGGGTLILGGVNLYNGVTTVTNGILIAANNAALGSTNGGTVVASGAVLRLGTSDGGAVTIGNEALTIRGAGNPGSTTDGALRANFGTNTWGGKVTLGADAMVRAGSSTGLIFDVDSGEAIDLQGHTLTLNNSTTGLIEVRDAITGNGGITKIGSGTATFSGANSYSGATTISSGVLRAGAAAGGQVFGNLSAVTLASAPDSQTALDLNNFSQTIGSLSGGGVGGNNLGVLLGSGTLTTGGNNTSTTYNGQISGTGGLVKTGTGTQTLTASNTYTGATTVQAGSLIINGSSASGSVLNVASGATLGGSGTIGGATTISGIHSPGNSPGIQTFGSNLTYTNVINDPAPIVQWELTGNTKTQGSPTPVFDQIIVGGNLDFAVPTTLTLNFALPTSGVNWSNELWASNITGTSGWLIYDVAGTLSNFENLSISVQNWADGQGQFFNADLPGSSFTLYQAGNDIYLNYAVPEPSTYALIILAGAGLIAHRWRSRRRSGGGSSGQ